MPTPVDPRIAFWQAGAHEIGMLEFLPTEDAQSRFPYYDFPNTDTFIGVMETDALCIDSNGSLHIYDHDSPNRVLCLAAIDQPSFIAAMLELERHFAMCDENDDYCDDIEAAETVRDRCAELAGGEAYLPFFTSMVGV